MLSFSIFSNARSELPFCADVDRMIELLTQVQQRQRIEREVRDLMSTKLDVSADLLQMSESSTPLLGTGIGLDSMEAMTLAVEIEEAFGIAILDEDLNEQLFSSFTNLADYIIKQLAEANA